MYVYALFDNETAELVIIKFLNAAVDKLVDIYLHSFQSPKVKDSAKRGIQCAHEVIFSEEIKKYYQTSPISVTLKDFKQQVDGSSAGLAYAVAFAAALKARKIIHPPFSMPDKIAATGELDSWGNVSKIKYLKQKILAAINESVDLMLYPSQNYDELKSLRQSDTEFDNLIERSGINLKHVSTLKQAFCELGIFPHPTISIEPIKSCDTSSLTIGVSLHNDILLEIKSFSLSIKYDNRLELEKAFEGEATKSKKNITYSIDKDKRIILSFNTNNDISSVLNKSVLLSEIKLLPADGFSKENDFEVKFEENNCTINFDPCKDVGGIILKSSLISTYKECFYKLQDSYRKTFDAGNFVRIYKKPLILSGILAFGMLQFIYTSYMSEKETDLNVNEPKASSIATTVNTHSPEPSTTVLVDAPLSPKPTVFTSPSSSPTPQSVTSPTPSQNTFKSPKSSDSNKQDVNIPSPSPKLATLNLALIDDFTAWTKKDKNSESRLGSEEGHLTDKAVRIDYNIKENGNVLIYTKPEEVHILPNKYKKLSFSYKCISEESCLDIVNLRIYYSNNYFDSFEIGRTYDLSKNSQWVKKEIDISNIKEITSLGLFIGCLPSDTSIDSLDKGSFLICDFKLSP